MKKITNKNEKKNDKKTVKSASILQTLCNFFSSFTSSHHYSTTGHKTCQTQERPPSKDLQNYQHWFFLLPCILIILATAGWPLFRTIYYSFTNCNLHNAKDISFVGLDNFLALFADSEWHDAFLNTVKICAISIPFETIFGMMIALILHKNFKMRGLMRTAILIPWAIPTIVSARIWAWMLNDVYGVINQILLNLSIIDEPIAWTAIPELSVISIIVVDIWKTTPYMAILMLAGLSSLPQDCFESAKVDGISPWKTFCYITLPLMRKTILVAVLFRTLDAFRIFDLVYILSSGNSASSTMSIYARKYLVDYANVGQGSAAATILLVIVAFFSLCWIYFNKKNVH